MFLTKSKIYETRIIIPEFVDKKFREIYFENTKYESWNLGMTSAAEEGIEKLIAYFILALLFKCKGNVMWNWGLGYAAKGGHEKLVDFFISKGANPQDIELCWAIGGQEKLVQYFISKGCKDWHWGMVSAARKGHEKLVKYFVSKGGKNWNEAMISAAEGGHERLVRYFISKGADWNWGMNYANELRLHKLAEFFKNKLS